MSGSGAEAADRRKTHLTTALDETVHQRYRLGILVITSRARQVEFGYLREALGLTSGNLSTHLMVLEEAGLVRVEKGYEGRRPRTWVSITRPGRAALASEMAALTELVREHNAGDHDAGDHSAGDHDAGDHDAGDHDAGDHDAGDHSAGDHDAGDHDASDHDAGDHSAGDHDAGDHDAGDHDAGDHSASDHNAGERGPGNDKHSAGGNDERDD